MNLYTIILNLNGKTVKYAYHATTEANAKELVKTKLFDALSTAQMVKKMV